MQITKCDKCKKEIKYKELNASEKGDTIKCRDFQNGKLDLCGDCFKGLKGEGYKTLACCCGHGHDIYPMTVVVEKIIKGEKLNFELFTNTLIPRKRNFYKRDKDGYYFIPEVLGSFFVN